MTEIINKKITNLKNRTKRRKDKMITALQSLTQPQRDIVCKNYFNKYDTFEDKIEELFKKKKIDLASTIYKIDKDLLYDFRKAANITKITPQNDFYSYINDKYQLII